MYKKYLILCMLIFVFEGCAVKSLENKKIKDLKSEEEIIEEIQNEMILQTDDNELQFNNKSIKRRINSIYEPKEKNIEIGQTITVVINENLSASSRGNKNLTKTGDFAKTSGVIGNATASGRVKDFLANKINPLTSIGMESSKSTSFSGNGSATRQETFETTITTFITKKINENLYKIEGSKEINISGQYQEIRISGYIRKRQLNGYQINSTEIANFKVSFESNGDVSETVEQNKLGRVIDELLF